MSDDQGVGLGPKLLAGCMGSVFLVVMGVFVVGGLRQGAKDASMRWGFVDANGAFVVEARFAKARGFHEGLAAVKEGDSWGWIDAQGTFVAPPAFTGARDFSEGLAAAQDPTSGLWGYVDRASAWVIQPAYSEALPFGPSGVACVSKRVGIATSRITTANPIYGFGLIDRTGSEVAPILDKADPKRWSSATPFASGLAVVKVGDAYGAVRPDGSFGIAPTFDRIGLFDGDLAPARQGKAWGFIDTQGKWAIAPKYAGARPFSQGWAEVKTQRGYTHISREGTPAYDGFYRNVRPLKESMAAVMPADTWGFVNGSGTLVIPPAYAEIGRRGFRGGVAVVGRPAGLDYEWNWVTQSGTEGPRWYPDADRNGFSFGLLAVRVVISEPR
jgi:hypothetical protein